MKLVAAAGKITVQAQDDDVEIIANKVLTFISQSDWIDLRGKKGVRLHGSKTWSKSVIWSSSSFVSRAIHGNLETLGPQNRPQPAAATQPHAEPPPEQLYFQLQSHALDGGELANVPYTLYRGDTRVEDGVTDEFGGVTVPHKTGTSSYSVKLATGDRLALDVVPKFAPQGDPQHREQAASNRGFRGLEATIEKYRRRKMASRLVNSERSTRCRIRWTRPEVPHRRGHADRKGDRAVVPGQAERIERRHAPDHPQQPAQVVHLRREGIRQHRRRTSRTRREASIFAAGASIRAWSWSARRACGRAGRPSATC